MRARWWGTAAAAVAAALACNGGLQPTPICGTGFVGVCGTVTYQGQLPDSLKDSTAQVFIIAYATFPASTGALFTFQPRLLPLTVPAGGPPHFYALPLPAGRYEWVLAVWQKKSTAGMSPQNADTLLREIGFYRDGADTTSHGSGIVTVSGTGTGSIDFVIDFSHMHRICDYFPPCPP
jgi:hypothetical protein